MKKTFIESTSFTERVQEFLGDEAYFAFQNELMDQPDKGRVIPGCGGLRKVRVADPNRQKGKRGGFRVIYLHVPDADWIFLLDIYPKDEKDDLSPAEKKILKQLADTFKKEALEAARRSKGRSKNES